MSPAIPRPDTGSSLAHPRVMLLEERPIHVFHSTWNVPSPKSFDMHYGLEVGVVLTGEMTRHVKGGRSVHAPGEMWFHNLWESHGWEVKTVPTEVLVLIIHPQALQQLRFPEAPSFTFLQPFTAPPLLRPRVPAARRGDVLNLASHILRHHESDAPLRSLQIRVLLLRLILLACEDWSPPRSENVVRPLAQESVEPALRLVAENRKFMSVGAASRASGMSVKAFRATFRSLMGVSFPRYALKYRVDGVALQLLQSSAPVKAIAREWGFTDTSHLDHSFRRFYGCFPTEYRARYPR